MVTRGVGKLYEQPSQNQINPKKNFKKAQDEEDFSQAPGLTGPASSDVPTGVYNIYVEVESREHSGGGRKSNLTTLRDAPSPGFFTVFFFFPV